MRRPRVDRRSDVDIESCLANLFRTDSPTPWYERPPNEPLASAGVDAPSVDHLPVARSPFPRRTGSGILDLNHVTMSPSQLLRSEKIKRGALQDAIFNSRYFSSIATDERGVIQIFNVGAERMLGHSASDLVDKLTPADISDPRELIERASALSRELGTEIRAGFEALVFKASRGIEDYYELTYIRKDGSRCPATVSVTALRDERDDIIGYLLIGTDNTARNQRGAAKALADQQLRDQNLDRRALIEANIDAVMVTDPNLVRSDLSEPVAPTVRPRHKPVGRRTRASSPVHSERQRRSAAFSPKTRSPTVHPRCEP